MNSSQNHSPVSYKILGILATVGLIIFFVTTFWPVFTGDTSELDIKPPISKAKAAEAAVNFVRKEFKDQGELRTSIYYQSQKQFIGYLQAEDLYTSYTKQFADKFPVEYYTVNVLNSDLDLHYSINVHTTSGKVVSWSSSYSSARTENNDATARQFAAKLGFSAKQLQLIHQTDGTDYQYRITKSNIGKASLLLSISISDGQVVSYKPFFEVPKEHTAWVKQQDHAASLMTYIGNLLMNLLMAITAIVFVIKNRKQVTFARGLFLTAVYVVLSGINNINIYPAYKALLDEESSSGAILTIIAVQNAFMFALAICLYFSFISGEQLWREAGWNPWKRWADSDYGDHVMIAMKRGYLIALGILGLQQALFLAEGRMFHMWVTNDPSSSPYNLLWPWMFPFAAWCAAIGEEAVYRLFGIAIFKKLVRNTFIACLIPTIIWAFGHTQYPIYPVYSRVIELTVLGLLFSFVFLKYGFITAIFAHAIMDSILMGLSLLSLGSVNFLAGLLHIVMPAIIAYVIYTLHHRFKKDPIPIQSPPAVQ